MNNVYTGLLKEIADHMEKRDFFKLITRNVYKGETIGQLMFEFMEPGEYYLFATTSSGDRPFANRTNDKVDDNEFPAGVLSSIPLELDFRIIAMKREGEEFSMQINKVSYTDSDRIELTEVYKGSTLGLYEPFLVRSVGEAVDKLKMKPILHWEQQINKHAFNPVRTIETHLMLNLDPSGTSVLQGYNKENKRIELSNNSKDAMIEESQEVAIAGIYRIFYYKKYKNTDVRFVSGIPLRHLTVHDVNEYTPFCEVGIDSIVNVHLVNGAEMLGLAIGQNIHLIYQHITGYKSVKLSRLDLEFVEKIESMF